MAKKKTKTVSIERTIFGVGESGQRILYRDVITYTVVPGEEKHPLFAKMVLEDAYAIRDKHVKLVIRGVEKGKKGKATTISGMSKGL